MKATVLYRIASVLLVIFAAGHTVGFLKLKPPTMEGLAVRDAMNGVHFQVRGHDYSYGGFYKGFGLFVTADMLFSAFLAWYLAGLASKSPQAIGALGWAFFVLQLATLALSWLYFAPLVTVFSGVLVVCLGWAAWQVK